MRRKGKEGQDDERKPERDRPESAALFDDEANTGGSQKRMQVKRPHDEQRRCGTRERHSKFRAHENRKAGFPCPHRQHDIEKIVDQRHP